MKRAQGRPGAGWHPRSVRRRRTRCGPQGSRGHPGLPCANGFTAYFVISPVRRALLPPSPRGLLWRRPGRVKAPPRDLTPASGARTTRLRRPRTSSPRLSTAGVCSPSKPSEDAVSAGSCRARPLLTILPKKAALQHPSRPARSRPPHPGPRFMTIAIRPFSGRDGITYTQIPNSNKEKCFCEEGLTGFCGDLPVRPRRQRNDPERRTDARPPCLG